MFARTARLTLRPGWPEDAPALARAIGARSRGAASSRARPGRTRWAMRSGSWRSRAGRDVANFLVFDDPAGSAAAGRRHRHRSGGRARPSRIRLLADARRLGPRLCDRGGPRGGRHRAPRAGTEAAAVGPFRRQSRVGPRARKLGFRPTGRIEPRACKARGDRRPLRTVRARPERATVRASPLPLAA